MMEEVSDEVSPLLSRLDANAKAQYLSVTLAPHRCGPNRQVAKSQDSIGPVAVATSHSPRSVTAGSIRAALRAGAAAETKAVVMSRTAARP